MRPDLDWPCLSDYRAIIRQTPVPTLFSHPAVPLAIAAGLGRSTVNWRLAVLGVLVSMLPDIDVLSFRLGIPYGHPFGHRGATHSLGFAVLIALLAVAVAARLKTRPVGIGLFVFVTAVSHPLLDMLTNGGHGVALLWPISNERYFFPVQVITVTTLDLQKFFGPAGLLVLGSEMRWVWLPCGMLALFLVLWRRRSV